MLDSHLLIATILVVIALLIYVLYWNRLLAFLIGIVLRVALWNKGGASAWTQIGSFHFSLLAGRVLLKDFHYYSSNQTIKAVTVQLRWRYWIRSPTVVEDMQAHGGGGGEEPKAAAEHKASHCRFHATFEGFEWFIYNRTAAYDNILAQMEAKTPVPERRAHSFTGDGATAQLRHIFSKSSAGGDTDHAHSASARTPLIPLSTPKFVSAFAGWFRSQLPGFDFKNLLPVSFEGINGYIVCGNNSTSSIMVAEFSRADGMFGAVPSKSPLDLYKQVFDIKFKNVLINMNENDQFQAPMLHTGSHLHDQIRKSHSLGFHYFHYLSHAVFAKLFRSAHLRDALRAAAQAFTKPPPPPPARAKTKVPRSRSKRAQSIDLETPVGPDSASREYAVERRLLEAPLLELSYYADAVGVVPIEPRGLDQAGFEVGNGDAAPEWGLDLVVHGGFLRYGPWADRQRAELQRVFFPPGYHDAEQTRRLAPGDHRIWTAMRIFIELRGGTTLNIPFREASKNWQWDGYVNVPGRPRTREGASLSIKAGDDSTISYLMPMVADAEGYHPLLEVHLDSVSVSSSLNDIRVLTAESCRVSADMPSPLKWNAHRQWTFSVSLRQAVFYLLRDHINMFTDLGKDWSSGPPSDYFTWIPMRYIVDLDFRMYQINMYVNDHNIIDKPLIRDENALLSLRGTTLRSENIINSDRFRPSCTAFPFTIDAPDVILGLTLPKWSTHRLQTLEPVTKLMTLGLLRLDGSYLYSSDVRPENVDQLKLKFTLNDVVFKCLAWSIRHFMIFQQNYFGSFTHFSTLREYLQKRERGQIGDPIHLQYRPGNSNSMQVELQVEVNRALIVLPVGLPGYEFYSPLPGQAPEDASLGGCVVLAAPEIALQLRSHTYGLELNFNVGPVYGDVESDYSERSIFARNKWFPDSEVFMIDGIDILANRLFGPQPVAAAYVCIWELNLGAIKGALSASQGRTMQSAFDAFGTNYRDPINAPAAEFALPADPDATFLKITLASVDLTWSAELASVYVSLPQGLRMESHGLAGNTYRKVLSLRVPKVVTRLLHASARRRNDWVEAGELVFDVTLDDYSCPPDWQESAAAQAKFLEEQDALTGRLRKFKVGLGKRGSWLPPRSIYTAVLKLPRPYFKAESSRATQAGPEGDAQNDADLTKPMPFPQRHLYSDSDDEGAYAAADNDARLVNSRPPSMMPIPHADDESMSSGDESDNMDLTEESSYESDTSEWIHGDPAAYESSLAFRYSRVSRHYALSTGRPSFWLNSPVRSLRDRRPFSPTIAYPGSTPPDSERSHYKRWRADLPGDTVSTSTYRILGHSAEVWVTPLLPLVVIHLLEDNSRAAMSPEQRIDSLITSHIRDLSSTSDAVKDSIFDIQLSSLRVQVVQLVHKPNDQHEDFLRTPDAIHHPADEVAVVDLQLTNFGLKGQSHTEKRHPRQSFAASVSHVGLWLNVNDLHGAPGQSRVRTFAKISLADAESALFRKRADLAWESLMVELGSEAADYTAEIVSAHMDSIVWAMKAFRRLQARVLAGARARLRHILQWSQKLSVVDPLSTIQPSYLVQTGRPHEIRVHAASKVLIYIRNCLRSLTPEEREAVHHLSADDDVMVTREEVIKLLEGQLAGLAVDADAASLANLNLLTRIFGAPDLPKPPPQHERPVQTVGIRLQSIRLIIPHPARGAPSELALGGVDILASSRKAELLLASMKSPKEFVPTRDRHRSKILHIGVSISLDSVEALMLPHILNFAQRLVRVQKRLSKVTAVKTPAIGPPQPQLPAPPQDSPRTSYVIDTTFSLNTLRFQVAAERLIVAYNVSRLTFVSSAYMRRPVNLQSRLDLSANASLLFDSVSLEAHSSSAKGFPVPQDMLAEVSVKQARFNCVVRHEVALSPTIRAVLVVGGLRFSVPRSAIRLSRFIEEWKADYLPGIEQTIQALVSEMRKEAPSAHASPKSSLSKIPTMHLQLSIGSCAIFLHVLPGTWLSWEIFNTLVYFRLGVGAANSRKMNASFGLRFSSQRVSITSLTHGERLEDALEKDRLTVDLPSMTFTGTYENQGIHVLVSAGFFSITVKPSYWDKLLSVQQKFGSDFYDLLHVLEDSRSKKPQSQKPVKSRPSRFSLQSGTLKARGFRIGLEGHSSTLFFECQDIDGGLKGDENKGEGLAWQINGTGLALSMAPRAYAMLKNVEFNGNHRSAFVIIDFKAEMGHRTEQKFLRVKVSKIHAIMQPSSIGEIGDFVDHLQAEVLDRKDERVREMTAFKEKTQSLMKAFEVNSRESASSEELTWLHNYATVFTVTNVGAAFPLAFDGNIELPIGKPHQHSAVPAFLFSVKSVEFEAKKSGHGQFVMRGFSFQFVDRFRQSVPGDFAGDKHLTRNRLIYPDMTAQVRTERSSKWRRIRVGANISGFILDVESSIAEHFSSLADVYRKGKERMDRLTANVPRNTVVQDLKPKLERIASETQEKSLPTSSVLLSFVFLSGQVRMHSGLASYTPRIGSFYDIKDNTLPSSVIESFNLPMLSVWGEYRAAPTSQKFAIEQDAEPSSLVLKSTIHSSENTLRPTLLPFMTDLINQVERRMRKTSSSGAALANARGVVAAVPLEIAPADASSSGSSMQITFGLRIDQSKLQLTCQPDVNVIAGVHWDSGGFLINVSQSGRRVSFIGNVGGLTIGLKHGFLSEDCVRLDAHNLAFSTTFSKADKSLGQETSSFSVVVDTEVSGGLRFSRFQDVLCFKAVWLDRIPVLGATGSSVSPDASPQVKPLPTPGALPPKNELTTAVLVRIRRIGLNVDLGQSISSVKLDLKDVVVRSKMEEVCAELSLSIGDLTLAASGNISGNARIPDFSFTTIRRKTLALDPSDLLGQPRMLDMSLKSGSLDLTLESDYQKILHLWSEPLSVTVWDDWGQMAPHVAVLDRLLRLSFFVSGTELSAVGTVGTIPKLVSYGTRFKANLEAQREGAARESKAFRIAQSPKPDNPLSAFANAMLQTARTRLREKEDSLSYVVQQRMQFSLESLRLVVFPRTMTDNEMASFSASELRAHLDLIVESSELPAKRKLHLSFAGMSASRVGPLNHSAVSSDAQADMRKWLDSLRKDMPVSTIFELPAMDMEMESEETGGVLEYSFVSQFARGDAAATRREDIFITLNVALYSWLTLLRKNLAREMNQVQGALDRRGAGALAMSPPGGTQTPGRRRTITESSPPDITALPSPSNRSVSPPPSRSHARPDVSTERHHKTTFSMSAMPSRGEGGGIPRALGPPIELVTSPLRGGPKSPAGASASAAGSPTSNTQSPVAAIAPAASGSVGAQGFVYQPRHRRIERLHMRQLGEATPDVMHPFFMKKAGFSLEDALPQYVHEYATMPIEEIMRALLKLYSKQLSGSAPQ
ncbi:hypothetical protein BC834DRAFT_969170 [Gloeopeniophorella convolvens]|nr:hypothetical protein BC834DRAFT_969170 [Gloeopeniophorella convolvens]